MQKNLFISKDKNTECRAGALVYWLREETHVLKVVGSNPSTIKVLDGHLSHIFVVKIVTFI